MGKHKTSWVLFAVICSWVVLALRCSDVVTTNPSKQSLWVGTAADEIPYYTRKDGPLIWYGHELVAKTAKYLGPRGTVLQISNGMNCQNCHLDAGTRPWGNNYGAVYANYPKFRDRSGSVETIYKRINDCIERSLNGKPLDTLSKEMQAIAAYINWLGEDVPKGTKPAGSGIQDLPFLVRAANPIQGKTVYLQKCQRCHGINGQGQFFQGDSMYQYPPLWGPHSYNTGAGLYRLSRLAGFIKNNMPFETDFHASQVSNEEAWDVAAFINTQTRPAMNTSHDWPNISKKPFDHPFGPYTDSFSVQQHQLGPFGAIKAFHEKNKH